MDNSISLDRLLIPVYINEKIVLDMLATIEDGFSKVSQINYTEHKESNSQQKIQAGISPTSALLGKLLKIDISGELNHDGNKGTNENIAKEKVHTNVSLFSKFRGFLIEKNMLKFDFDISQIKIGDFMEIEGELQKNPLINYLELFLDFFRLTEIFSEKPQLGGRTQEKNQREQNNKLVEQIKSLYTELKHSGTVDFILSEANGTVVLSVQEQYLANDNISEIIGGSFKVLGKVISICESQKEINLLRKTSLSVLPEEILNNMLSGFQNKDMEKFALPELKIKIKGPAVIIIPVAIYA